MTDLLPLLATAVVALAIVVGVVATVARRPVAGAVLVFGALALVGV